ncbi:hypothetical protein V3W47_07590 [Deinococcus sp. YIM 134068]|uniref:hypothetical protein n=1 Tax=Deinococcus lichenicola TaxID=3118910 RepID=UPI002F955203
MPEPDPTGDTFEVRLGNGGELTVTLGDRSIGYLIEMLWFLREGKSSGGRVRFDADSGLEGNVNSITLIRR